MNSSEALPHLIPFYISEHGSLAPYSHWEPVRGERKDSPHHGKFSCCAGPVVWGQYHERPRGAWGGEGRVTSSNHPWPSWLRSCIPSHWPLGRSPVSGVWLRPCWSGQSRLSGWRGHRQVLGSPLPGAAPRAMIALPPEITPLGYPLSSPPTLVAPVLGFGQPLCGLLSGLYLQCVLSLKASAPSCGDPPRCGNSR